MFGAIPTRVGRPAYLGEAILQLRIIPTHVGDTIPVRVFRFTKRDNPHVCGGDTA